MRRVSHIVLTVCAICSAAAPVVRAEAKAEEQVVGPAGADAKYVVSPGGAHLATVAPKGSRVMVVVDGVPGPKLDAVITSVATYVDPRPAQAASAAGRSVTAGPAPVIFSNDGKHYAYLGRSGDEWVLIEDGKELVRLPGGGLVGAATGVGGLAGSTDVRIQFAGDDGKHLLLAKSGVTGGYELWVDGQKWPGAYGSAGSGTDATDPLISPDGSRIAYVAQVARDKAALIVDGQDAGYLADHLQWTPDGKHLVGIGHSPKGDQGLLIDGKPLMRARGILGVYLAPVGNRIILALDHRDPKTGAIGQFLLVDGKPVEPSLCEQIKKVIFSPDGKHYAALCGKSGAAWVVVDGKKGEVYQSINEGPAVAHAQLAFSPDSSKVAYVAMSNAKWFAVTGDDESDAFYNAPGIVFSPDGKHMAIGGMPNPSMFTLAVDGKTTRLPSNKMVQMATFTFSPDGSHHAALMGTGPNAQVMLDGAETGISGSFSFSPDGKHLAIAGYRATDGAHGMFIDGKLVASSDQNAIYFAFSPDSQHLCWMARGPAARKDAPPGTYEFITYIDGQPVARTDQRPGIETILLPNGYGSSAHTMPAWDISPDGALTSFAMSDDGVKRVKVTPAADTSVATMLANAQAAGSATPKR